MRRRLEVGGCVAAFPLLGVLAYYAWWPTILVVLVPLALLVARVRNPWAAGAWVVLAGALHYPAVQFFFGYISIEGLLIGGAWQGLTCLPFGLALWLAVWRWRLPLGVALPVFWVADEYLRMFGIFAMPSVIAVAAHGTPWIIQVADLGGVYAVSFALAVVSAVVADGLRRLWPDPAPAPRWRTTFAVGMAVWLFVGGYGFYRLDEAQATMTPGPRVAVVQPDVPRADGIGRGFDPVALREQMQAWSEAAVAAGAEIVVWPETFGVLPPLNEALVIASYHPDRARALGLSTDPRAWQRDQAARREARAAFAAWAEQLGATLWIGERVYTPHDGPEQAWTMTNSAVRWPRAGDDDARQDKVRLFPVGEYVPWEGTWFADLLRRLRLADDLSAARDRFTRGTVRQRFTVDDASAAPRYAVHICSEVMYPDPALRPTDAGKPVDFLLVMANDGSYRRSAGAAIHFSFAPYRAVEQRVGLARSANAGISGFVRPDGAIAGTVTNTAGQRRTGLGAPELPLIRELVAWRREHADQLPYDAELQAELARRTEAIVALRAAAGVSGYAVATLALDPRVTFYARHGDLFANALLTLLLGALGLGALQGGCSRDARRRAGREASAA